MVWQNSAAAEVSPGKPAARGAAAGALGQKVPLHRFRRPGLPLAGPTQRPRPVVKMEAADFMLIRPQRT